MKIPSRGKAMAMFLHQNVEKYDVHHPALRTESARFSRKAETLRSNRSSQKSKTNDKATRPNKVQPTAKVRNFQMSPGSVFHFAIDTWLLLPVKRKTCPHNGTDTISDRKRRQRMIPRRLMARDSLLCLTNRQKLRALLSSHPR